MQMHAEAPRAFAAHLEETERRAIRAVRKDADVFRVPHEREHRWVCARWLAAAEPAFLTELLRSNDVQRTIRRSVSNPGTPAARRYACGGFHSRCADPEAPLNQNRRFVLAVLLSFVVIL